MALADISELTEAGLRPVTGRPPLGTYFRQLWARRFYIHAEARSKAFTAGRNMILGNLWIILTPLLDAAIYGFIFGVLLHTSRGVDDFVPYLIVGMTFFSLLVKNVNAGIGLLESKRRVIKAFSFPRASIVLSVALKNLLDSLPVIVTSCAVVLFFSSRHLPTLTWLLVPLIYVVQVAFATGLMFVSCYLTERIPDLSALFPIVTRVWFFSSGIFYSVDNVVAGRKEMEFLLYNPAHILMEMMRDCLVYHRWPDTQSWGIVTAWAVGTLTIGFLLFWSRESEYARGKD